MHSKCPDPRAQEGASSRTILNFGHSLLSLCLENRARHFQLPYRLPIAKERGRSETGVRVRSKGQRGEERDRGGVVWLDEGGSLDVCLLSALKLCSSFILLDHPLFPRDPSRSNAPTGRSLPEWHRPVQSGQKRRRRWKRLYGDSQDPPVPLHHLELAKWFSNGSSPQWKCSFISICIRMALCVICKSHHPLTCVIRRRKLQFFARTSIER